jgi:protein TonB
MNRTIRAVLVLMAGIPSPAFAADQAASQGPPGPVATPPAAAAPAPARAAASVTGAFSIEGSYQVTASGARIEVKRLFGDFYRLTSESEGWDGVGVLEGRMYLGVFRYSGRGAPTGMTGEHLIQWTDADHATVRGAFVSKEHGEFEANWARLPGSTADRADPERRARPMAPPARELQVVVQPPAGDELPKFGDYVHVEELPEAITKVQPIYPEAARQAKVEGTVLVQALVGKDGAVRDTRIVGSIPGLDEAAVASVRQWRFKPAMSKGAPVAVWVAVPVRFALP